MSASAARIFVLVCLYALKAGALQPANAETRMEEARKSLTGEHKDAEKAKNLLLGIVQAPHAAINPGVLSYAYVYLGYIEDRAGSRARAIDWYEKALKIDGGSPGILDVARLGLKQPVTWIRHLDAEQSLAVSTRPAKAYVTSQPPTGITLARNLTAKERHENFDALWSAIDVTYAAFNLKRIDWKEVGQRYKRRLDTVSGDDDFYLLMFQLVNELKDSHSWLQNFKMPGFAEGAGLSIDLFAERAFVVSVESGSEAALGGTRPGWEVLSVDGLTVADKIEALRLRLHACSSERAYRCEATRHVLAGEAGRAAIVELRSPDNSIQTAMVQRRSDKWNVFPARAINFALTRQRFVHFARLPSGLGYIWIESFEGRQEIADEFDRALEALRDTPGLILDIRDNKGGFGQARIVGRFLQKRTLTSIGYIKNGPAHHDLGRHENYLVPTGKWQYKRPVALLVNDVTGSAADLFACELRSARRVVTVGTTTHGNLSGVASYVVLPCGLVVRVSNGYVSDAQDRPIEGVGNIPDVLVERSIRDFLDRKDPVLDEAVNTLTSRRAPTRAR